mmetsp:Transcript_6012/g.25173  ORF Transcript_6012/g.25173 Transcript_6012/m.25173 type:complete len:229 (+) Transcript_6012:651-1337(+)
MEEISGEVVGPSRAVVPTPPPWPQRLPRGEEASQKTPSSLRGWYHRRLRGNRTPTCRRLFLPPVQRLLPLRLEVLDPAVGALEGREDADVVELRRKEHNAHVLQGQALRNNCDVVQSRTVVPHEADAPSDARRVARRGSAHVDERRDVAVESVGDEPTVELVDGSHRSPRGAEAAQPNEERVAPQAQLARARPVAPRLREQHARRRRRRPFLSLSPSTTSSRREPRTR